MEPVEDIGNDVETGPFHGRQRGLGATFYEDMGWLWTRSFGDPAAEYWAVRRDAGLWDVSALVKWRFTGPDALAALERLTTRGVTGLSPGAIRYGAMLNDDGLMLDEGTVLVTSQSDAFFFGNDEREPFVEHLERETHGLDVRVENVTARIPNIAIQGPRSYEIVSRLTDVDVSDLRWFHLVPEPITLAGARGWLTRTGFTGELGYEFFLESDAGAETLWDAVLEQGVTPFGLDAIEMLRVEAGLLIQYEDYVPGETDPYEVALEPFIELEGHDFVGREAAARRASAPPRRMVTLVIESEDVPEPGARVTSRSVDVGDVRSPYRTPRFGTLALAVVEADAAGPGRTLDVDGRPATLHRVPIDDPGKRRPRADPRRRVRIEAEEATAR
jgi:aminomethyltransferase